MPADNSEKGERDQIVPIGSLSYMRSAYSAPSAWTEHVPFAFWLVEALRPSLFVELGAHWGVSYFAFCQALDKLDLGAKAFAVDKWTGDAHAGDYGPEVYEAVRSHNRKKFEHFSSLIKLSFDDAKSYFADSTIDLLHLDGFHTYDAVRHDFEGWLPKMSERGVVILHDTNVREREFGVFQLFGELKESFPTFEFVHGYGLGVVGVGAKQAERLERLYEAEGNELRRHELHTLFSTLGRASLDSYKNQDLEQKLARLTSQRELAVRQADEKVAALTAELERQAAETDSALAQRQDADRAAIEFARLRDELGIAAKERAASEKTIEGLREQVAALTAQFDRCEAEKARIEEDCRARVGVAEDARATEVARLTDALEQAVAAHAGELQKLRDENAAALLDNESREKIARLEFEAERQQSDVRLNERFDEIAALSRLLREKEADAFEARQAEKLECETALHVGATGSREIGRAMEHILKLPRYWDFLPEEWRMKRKIALLDRTGLFDPEWYVTHYKDVAEAGLDPRRHYVEYGAAEGREPNDVLARARREID